ncbi:matrixin family metalloprotease [Arthrobacter sp. PsM3]|uniref:matrixin family metalloprotease n=1 Tax=Arthrobacter sp. PsM3 TaxID=3030531 RepID=UPI00263B0E7B|nr:matrixin family metalloprotease [Arthrobacter sp. PsM3]MDN4642419.1 matrixin family metalloprotease [Arthrobacter sp. PsM3]
MDGPEFRDRTPRHSRSRTTWRIIRGLATAALIAGAAFLAAGFIYGDPRFAGLFEVSRGTGPGRSMAGQAGQPAQPGQPAAAEAVRTDTPPPGLQEQDEPLGRPQKPALSSSSYKFLAMNDDGTPVGYSPCRPLHFVVNAAVAPEGAERLVDDAIRTVSRATGIKFVNDGPTAEQPSQSRVPYQQDVYGERWAPLLIAWTTPEQAPQLKGPVIGTGGSTHFSFGAGPKSFVTGSLELDAPQIAEDLNRRDGAAYATAVILHELGHVMGLEHVDDPTQLMYPEIGAPDGLAAGDLNGLYELGKAHCRKDL